MSEGIIISRVCWVVVDSLTSGHWPALCGEGGVIDAGERYLGNMFYRQGSLDTIFTWQEAMIAMISFSGWFLKNIFPELCRTLNFNFQDFPGPGILRRKSKTSQEPWEPCQYFLQDSVYAFPVTQPTETKQFRMTTLRVASLQSWSNPLTFPDILREHLLIIDLLNSSYIKKCNWSIVLYRP